ncbi:TolC family protein [bacterium]|jgi:outer membrane protein, heavy metal efflux system|nr:TolC family protein [bacterium]
MKKIKLSICILIVGNALLAAPASINSVNDAVKYGVANNPMIKAQSQVLNAKKNLPKKMGSLSDPKIGFRLNGTPAKNSNYSFDQRRIFINQSFPFLGKLARKNELGNKEVSISELDFEMAKNEVSLSIQSLYYNLVLNKELVKITEKNNKIFENIVNIADIKYRSGKTLQANVLKARVSKGKIEEKLLNLAHQEVKITEELKKWLGGLDNDLISIAFVYPKPIETTFSAAMPSVIFKTLMVQKAITIKNRADQILRVENDRYLPNFSAQVESWNNSGMEHQYSGQIAMTVPWFNEKNSSTIKEATSLKNAKGNQLVDTQNNVKRLLVTLLSDLKTTKETIKLYDEIILKNAALSLSSFQKAFEVDKASFLDYFESEKTLFSLEMDYAKLVNRTYILQAKITSLFKKGVETE